MTEHITIEKANTKGIPTEPLTWSLVDDTVYLVCNNSHIAGLQHDIDSCGVISPSVLCLTPMPDGSECRWHVFAKLEGWNDNG